MPRVAARSEALARSALMRRVAARAATDPDAVLPVLRVLVGEDEPADVDESVLGAAEIVNSRRLARATRTLVSRALTTEQVSERLGGASRQAIAARRARGGLLGLTVGTTAYHPDWQFGPDGLLPGLARVLDALRGVRASVLSADALMRAPAPGDSHTLAELLADGRVDEVVARILDTGGGL